MSRADRASRHVKRALDRASARAERLMKDRTIDANRLTIEATNAFLDGMDVLRAIFGGGSGSPQVSIADFGDKPSADWVAGLDITVRLIDDVPSSATWPANAALNANALKLRKLDGTAVDLQLTNVDRRDDGYELKISMKDLGAAAVAAGEYFAPLFYTDGGNKFFACLIRGKVT